jgi:excisionase family DNA binding protein
MATLSFNDLPGAVSDILTQVREIHQRISNGDVGTPQYQHEHPIDTKELCKRLAITEPTAIRWRKRGKIPFMSIGSSIRYDWQAVLTALQAQKKGKNT